MFPKTFSSSPIVTDLATPNPPLDVIAPVVLDVLFVLPCTAKPPPMIPDEEVFKVLKAAAHLLVAAPNPLPLADGCKLVSTLPVNDTVSVLASPISTDPFKVVNPSTVTAPSKSAAPLTPIVCILA